MGPYDTTVGPVKLTGNTATLENGFGELRIGDKVDEAFYWYFIEVLPPANWTKDLVQLGEAVNHTAQGLATYSTLMHHRGEWVFVGNCTRTFVDLPEIVQ